MKFKDHGPVDFTLFDRADGQKKCQRVFLSSLAFKSYSNRNDYPGSDALTAELAANIFNGAVGVPGGHYRALT